MIDYTAADAFTATQIYDLSDLVKGGTNGASNLPIKALLDRTQYLFNRLYKYDSALPVASSATIDNSVIGKFVSVSATNANVVLSLNPLSTFPYGYVLPIAASCAALKNVTIQANGSEIIYLNGSYMENMIYMHDGEVLYLLRDVNTWTVIAYKGNFERVGECMIGYVAMKGTIYRNGSLVNRADYPRLWWWINNVLTYGQQVVDDSTWLSDVSGAPVNRGFFSRGNTTSTFRLPDDRGMFDRYLDMGRGLDTNRTSVYAGGFEEMMIQSHSHRFHFEWNGTDGTTNDGQPAYNGDTESHGSGYNTTAIEATGGNSTHPRNNGKFPLIIY